MARRLSTGGAGPRGRRLAVLVAAVAAAHLWLADEFAADRLGWGAGASSIRRIEVAFVRDLQAAAPPVAVAAAAPAPPAAATRAVVARPPASAPEAAAPPPPPPPPPPEPVPEPPAAPVPEPAPPVLPRSEMARAEAPDASAPALSASAPAALAAATAPAAAASAPSFDWPPSTRLSYELRGNYRGEVQGTASVEWVRQGPQYQVQLEAVVGPAFAPLMARRIISEGELGADGLAPRRFEGEQRVGFRTRKWSLRFEPDRIVLADGREAPPREGVQDEASQFVQLTWLFTTQPQLLQPGRTVEVPLALPRRVDSWFYDVDQEERLQLPFGEVAAVHVKPRRGVAKPGDLVVEIWVAPTLQYLPVRILIQQDAGTFIDLALKRPPQQALR